MKRSLSALTITSLCLFLVACEATPTAPGTDGTTDGMQESSVGTVVPTVPGTMSSVRMQNVSSVGGMRSSVKPVDSMMKSSAPGGAMMEEEEEEPSAMEERTITVTVENFAFAPNAITVKKGEKITLQLKGVEGMHGIAIPGLGISVAIAPGQTKTITLPTDKVGTFAFYCNVPCGPGHKGMTGTVIVA